MSETSYRGAVADPAQIRLLRSPVRQELLDTLAALGGEAGVAALSEQLGRPADGLYYHLGALVRGGLVLEMERPPGDDRRFRLAGEGSGPFRLAYDLGPQGNVRELEAFVRGLLQIAARDFDDAVLAESVLVNGPRRELWASRNKGWLSPDDIGEVNALLERLSALTSQPKSPMRTRLMSCAFVLTPIDPRAKRRSPSLKPNRTSE